MPASFIMAPRAAELSLVGSFLSRCCRPGCPVCLGGWDTNLAKTCAEPGFSGVISRAVHSLKPLSVSYSVLAEQHGVILETRPDPQVSKPSSRSNLASA